MLNEGRWLGEARTAPGHRLISMGWYPALIRSPEGASAMDSVVGEVYLVPPHLLPALDEYEDVPALYTRQPVQLIEGPVPEAVAYMLHDHLARGRPVIASGDWRNRGATGAGDE